MNERGAIDVGPNGPAVTTSEVCRLERLVGRETVENEILREASEGRDKDRRGIRCRYRRPVFGEPRDRGSEGEPIPNPHEASVTSKRSEVMERHPTSNSRPRFGHLVDRRPTNGYRRLTALLNSERHSLGLELITGSGYYASSTSKD